MIRIVADTNVLISATFLDGDSNKIIEKVEKKELGLLMSKEILGEFSNVLGYKEIQDKIKNENLEVKRTIEKIASLSVFAEPQEKFKIIIEDPDDDKFLDCAVAGKAGFIISKDKHLLKLKEFKGIKIVKPDEFLRVIGANE